MKKSALGRGLDALFPQTALEGEVLQLALSRLDVNPSQPRKHFDGEGLRELADSILEVGLLQPILACPQGDRYRIIAGERRFRAAMLAGLQTVPVLVRTLPEQERVLAALVENLQREDLNPMESALGVRALMDESGLTQEEAAKKLGKSRPAIANLLRLLQLLPAVQDLVRQGLLTEGHARVLAGIQKKERQLALAEQVVAQGLSVRALEALAAAKPVKKPSKEAAVLPELAEFQERLQTVLGLRTQISGGLKKGRIILKYGSFEELESLYEAIERLAQ